MRVIGLTGSMGMGKTTTANLFRALGHPVYDADQTVHNLYEGEAVTPVGKVFPNAIVDNSVSRERLKAHLAKHPEDLKKLESIIHPLVRRAQQNWLSDHVMANTPMVILDIPLLFETGGDQLCDAVIVVSAGTDIQMKRLIARGTMSEAQINNILDRQMSDAQKRQKADYLIDTSISINDAKSQIEKLIPKLMSLEPQHKWRDSNQKSD